MKRAVAAVALMLWAALAQGFQAEVSHVTDGDTVWLRAEGRAPIKLRLDGLDAPERCQRGGEQAREALTARVLHRQVEVLTRAHDQHGRAIGTLQLEGADVGGWLVAQGHAWNARFRRHPGRYAAQEQAARAARRGLFADAAPELPRDFRRRHGPCQPA